MRQHGISVLNLTQQPTRIALGADKKGDRELSANIVLINSVREFARDVRELDIELIDRFRKPALSSPRL